MSRLRGPASESNRARAPTQIPRRCSDNYIVGLDGLTKWGFELVWVLRASEETRSMNTHMRVEQKVHERGSFA